MSAVLETSLGKLTYSDDYIANIVGVAATECYGVVGMSAKKATDGIFELLKRDNVKKGVRIFTDETNGLRIDLSIVVEYGVSISAVASSIMETVRYMIEKTTSLTVREVNITVSGIRV